MKITNLTVTSVPLTETTGAGTQNAWIVQLETDEGVSGCGEIGLCYGTGGIGAAHLAVSLAEQLLIGRDPSRIEKLHDDLIRKTFWGMSGGALYMAAVSAIDEALWDIKGKVLGAPIHALLGGAAQDDLWLYANGWSRHKKTPEQLAEAAASVVADGFGAMKFDPFKDDGDGLPDYPRRSLPKDREDLAVARITAVRDAAPDAEIIVEYHGNIWPVDAARFANRIADLKPYYLEEVVEPLNIEAAGEVAKNVGTPLAGGERLWSRTMFRPFLERGILKLIQPDMGVAGGFTEVKKIAAMAEAYDCYLQPHNCGGPISTAACVNLAATCPNFLIQEIFPYWKDNRYEIVQDPYETDIKDGRLALRDKPGLGVTLNHDFLARFDTIGVL